MGDGLYAPLALPMHKTVGFVLLGVGAVIILYLVSKGSSLGNYFGLIGVSASNPSPLTPKLIGYDSTGKAIFAAPTVTPYGAANTGVQSSVTNDILVAGGVAAAIAKLFAPAAQGPGYPLVGPVYGPPTPSGPPAVTLSASDLGTPTLADQGKSVSQDSTAFLGGGSPSILNVQPVTNYPIYGAPTIDPSLSVPNNPVDYANFGIPDPIPPASPGYIPGGGSGFFANDFSGYNVPNTVVDLTGVAAPPPPPPDPTAIMV